MLWRLLNHPIMIMNKKFGDIPFTELCCRVADLSKDVLEVFCVRCWCVWSDRNSVNRGLKVREVGVKITHPGVSSAASRESRQPLVVQIARWKPPVDDGFKFNVDASCISPPGQEGIAARFEDGIVDILAAEASAMLDRLK
ncbi:unnamed protein product [Citrullus colocynthis]|uniref:Reverse transcriptase n=1 Tax=Citrullus colocynthis TaxID=252529 RepID=A0ABP0YZT8_9ROSI